MIAEIGHFALILAMFVALAQSVLPMIGAARGQVTLMRFGLRAACLQFILVALAFGALISCYVTSDFSVLNVVENSHTAKPLFYKIAGVWGNHEGSMVLWIFILAFFGMMVALFAQNLPLELRARALSVQAMIAFGFDAFILFTSNPFLRISPAPLQGEGLNPVLQDPGLAFHPPFLYLGYVGFSMSFSFAIAALIEGRVDASWARWVRPWTLLTWSCLTLGIAMGSWWAYYTLGWGGWWYWDPVENASFMPWLSGTALIHSLIVVEKRGTLKSWTILLTILTFSFSMLGTFLVRSGALTSVHSFAADPARGVFILILLVFVIGGSLTLFALKAPHLKREGLFAPISRESGLLLNNLFLTTAAASILLGTLYPLLADTLHLGKISVGPPFFNIVFIPLMVPLLIMMGIGPLLSWKRADLGSVLKRLKVALGAALGVMALVYILGGGDRTDIGAAGGMGLAMWLATASLIRIFERVHVTSAPLNETIRRLAQLPRSTYGGFLAHFGIAVLVAGITGSTAWKSERIETMRIGDKLTIAAYNVTLESVTENIQGPNYTATRATFVATKQGKFVARLMPERRLFIMPPAPTTDAAIHTNLLGDLYAVIGDGDGKGRFVVRLYFNPLVPWIFIGAVLAALGGTVSLSDRRHRVGRANRSHAVGSRP